MRLRGIIFFLLCSLAILLLPLFSAASNKAKNFYTSDIKFIKNSGETKNQFGETNIEVLFSAHQPQYNTNIRHNGFSYDFFQPSNNDSILARFGNKLDSNLISYDYHRIDVEFIGSKKYAEFSATAKSIRFYEVYPGVDIDYLLDGGKFKYNIIAKNKIALSQVQVAYIGALAVSKNSDSSIGIKTAFGEFEETIPLSFFTENYETNSLQREVNIEVILTGNVLRYSVHEDFLENELLVIDPLPHLQWASYSGGISRDELQAIQIDESGNTYIGGFTQSTQNIATSGNHQGSLLGIFNCYIQKFDTDGNLVWGTYYGGTVADRCYGMKLDKDALFICGSTFSGDNIATPGVHQTNIFGQDDAFLAKFSLDGELIWGTYFGGEKHDFFADIAVDNEENIIVTGHTTSEINIATLGAHLDYLPGVENAIVAKFNSSGQRIWSTYFGNQFDEGWGVDVDVNNNIYITGITSSQIGIASPNTHQSTLAGETDAFLAKFSPNGTSIWGTYFGGAQYEVGNDLVTTDDGDSFIIGITGSNTGISTSGAHQESMGSIDDSFLARFDNQGNLIWSTYIGGDQVDVLNDIAFDNTGKLVMAGYTQSSNNIAVSNAFQSTPAGLFDAFIMVFAQDGTYEWGTYFGSDLTDEVYGVAVDPSTNHIAICGYTQSESGISTTGVAQENYGGGILDGFVARFCVPPFPTVFTADDLTACASETLNFEVESIYASYNWSLPSTTNTLSVSQLANGTYEIYVDVVDETGCPGYSDTLTLSILEEVQPIISASALTLCQGDTIVISLATTHDNYNWSTGENTSVISTENWAGGIYDVYVSVEGNNLCPGTSDTLQIEVYGIPNPLLQSNGSINFCLGETVEMSTVDDYFTYEWYDGSNQSSIILTEETAIWVTVTNIQGCTKTSDTVVVNADLFLAYYEIQSNDPICRGDEFTISVTEGFNSYDWSNGMQGSLVTIPTESLPIGPFEINVILNNACGGSATLEIDGLIILDTPEPLIVPSSGYEFCPGDSLEISAQSFTSYNWSNGNTAQSQYIQTPGEYWVEVTSSEGCIGTSPTIQINYFPIVQPVIVTQPENTFCIEAPIILSIQGDFPSITWSTGELSNEISIEQEDSGSYTYYVDVIDENGCILSDTVSLFIDDCLTISGYQLNPKINVYPNPAASTLRISMNENTMGNLQLINTLGQLVYHETIDSDQHHINVSNLPNGVYILDLKTTTFSFQQRVVITR